MKVIVFGLGSAGRRHVGLMQKFFPEIELFAFRTGTKAGIDGVKEVRRWADVKKLKADVAMICNPTNNHIETATKCAKLGLHLFVEKPIDATADGLNKLLKIIRDKQLKSYVAYPLRFHPSLANLKGKLIGNKKNCIIIHHTDLREWVKPYSTKRETGGGAVLELSHEIDLAEFLFGKVVTIAGSLISGSNKVTSAETVAGLTTYHKDGTEVSIDLNLAAKKPVRSIRFASTVKELTVDYGPGLGDDEMYRLQLGYFFGVMKTQSLPMNNLHEASDLFVKIAAIK